MMRGPLTVRFVATDGEVWQGEAVSVLVRTTEGDIGILVGHEPFMAALVPHGAEVVGTDGVRHIIAIDSGFLSVFANHVSVLSAFGELAEEISQLMYHAQVLMVAKGLTLEDVYSYL